MNYNNSQIITDGAMTGVAVVNSSSFDLSRADKWSYQLSFARTTAPLTGAYKVQVSNDDGTPVTWADLAGATGNVADAASGTIMVNFDNANYASARVVYTNATGVGVLQVKAVSKS